MSWIEGENVHAILGDTILLYLYDQIMNFLFALSYLNDLTEILHDFLLYLRDLIMSIFGLMFLVLLGVTIGPSLRRPRGCVKYRGRNRHAYYHGGSVPVVPLVGLVVRDRCCLGRPQHKVEVEFPKLIGERVKDMVTMTMKMKKWRM